MLFLTAAFSVRFHGTKIGVGPYSAGSSTALKIIGSSCCLGHEGSALIHQVKYLASSSEKPLTYLPVPSWYCPSRSWQKREELPFILLSMPRGCSREPPYVSSLLLQCLFHDWKSVGTVYILLKPLASSLPLSSCSGCCSVLQSTLKCAMDVFPSVSLDKSCSPTAEQACLVFTNGVLQRG